MKRTEWSGYYDNTGSRICNGDILFDIHNKMYYRCEKQGKDWCFIRDMDRMCFKDAPKTFIQQLLTIVVFENEEE
jgi:hypothetical protein